MTKKVRHWRGRSKTTNSVIKTVNKDSFAGAICPTNVEEQKKKFLEYGKSPEFIHRGTDEELEEIYSSPRSEIRFDLLGEALHILKTVKEKYGDAENYYNEMYGDRITKLEATDIIVDYLKENRLDGAMTVIWCTDLPCSGRMMWQGPQAKYRRPEARKYSMWIKDSKDNNFLREQGIRCLADHEIGTHFFRSFNDGLQPWFADRAKFGIRGLTGLDQLRTEEGLAAVNTILNARVRYLWGPALLYYIACKATEMTFKQLFDHLSIYVANPEVRWRHCVRVKRGLLNPNDIGGYGKDQCYFEGAVQILRNVDNIDFKVLMAGKVCYDEINRVKKLARTDCIQMPDFMRNQEKYKKSLKQISHMNGLHLSHPKYKAPAAYLRRLKKGRRTGARKGSNKVRKKGQKGEHSNGFGKNLFVSTDGEGESEDESLHSAGWENEDKFVFEQLNFPSDANNMASDRLFEAFAMGSMPGISAGQLNELNKRHSMNYFRSLVNKLDLMKQNGSDEDKSVKGVVTVKTCEKSDSKDNVSMNDYDTTVTDFRSVSRASVRSMLNQRSNSLASRGSKSLKAEPIETASSVLQRPASDKSDEVISPGRSSTTTTTPSMALRRSEASSFSSVPLSHHRYSIKCTPIYTPSTVSHSQLNHEPATDVPITEAAAQSNFSTENRGSTSAGTSTSSHPHMPKSRSTQNIVKTGVEGFIYPDTDMLTDDMLTVKVNSPLYDPGSLSPEITAEKRLLTRRAKSAANMLPKLSH